GGFSQVASVTGVFVLLRAGWGIDGAFAGQAAVAWFTVLAYLVPLSAVIFARGKITSVRRGEMRKLMVGAWLTNVSNTALGKQMDIMVMTAFAVGSAAIGYYNLAYQLGSIIGVVLISGLGGVGMAAMSAALSTGGPKRLISMWRASIMLQVILAVPLQTVCFVFADQIVTVLYGSNYAGAVLLLRVFLAFTMFGRLIGGGASQGALYVIGKQRSVVVLRWSGLIINVILDVTLIQVYGPIGAMIATGFSQVWVGLMEYLLLRLHLGTEYPIAFAGRVTGVAAFAALLVLWWAPGGLIGLIAEFSLFGALFAFGLWITNSEGTNDLTELMLANPRLKAIFTRVGRLMPRIKPATVTAST
ncbi:MAG TPA: polysaccharide biosynthesis C-terminal domain-containing protein, partial [Ktedonobacterales bacterium]|nr:polysaccharide biosynthesis C-terminal domain-containing protein [Ktedonobacterales bacterium]